MQNYLIQIITISLCGELLGVDSENAWFSFVKRITDIFFEALQRSRFNRTRRALMQTTELLRQKMLSVFRFRSVLIALLIVFRLQSANLDVHDTAKHFATRVLITESALLKKETYFGYKVHALVTLNTAFRITPHPQMTVKKDYGICGRVDNCSNITIFSR